MTQPLNLDLVKKGLERSSSSELRDNRNEMLSSASVSSAIVTTSTPRVSKVKRFRTCRHSWQPYPFPWRPKLEETYRFFSLQGPLTSAPTRDSPSLDKTPRATESAPATCSVSRQDSGNKSNPSSPVKNQSPFQGSFAASTSECSIIRSRSLGHLDFKSENCDRISDRLFDVDTVSQRISNLHVV